jgi:hypothetical protein
MTHRAIATLPYLAAVTLLVAVAAPADTPKEDDPGTGAGGFDAPSRPCTTR